MDHCINITICVDNDAFGETYDEQAAELGRILRHAAKRIEANPSYIDPYCGTNLCLNDINGNRVGHVTPEILSLS
jgi:hypothetical protein